MQPCFYYCHAFLTHAFDTPYCTAAGASIKRLTWTEQRLYPVMQCLESLTRECNRARARMHQHRTATPENLLLRTSSVTLYPAQSSSRMDYQAAIDVESALKRPQGA